MDRPRSSHNPPPRRPSTSSYPTQAASAASPAVARSEDASPSVSPRPSTSLPPIHTLHPNLPPTSMQHHPMSMSTGYTHTFSGYPPGGSGSGSVLGTRPAPDDSDPEGDLPGPPKKKRRRQALSCTECKRRKIKCDRAQPCGPCSRRGEQGKCQWHIIEPMEKYVTRGEYDELKHRFEELQAYVYRYMPALHTSMSTHPTGPMSAMPMSAGHGSDSVQGNTVSPYHTSSTSSNLAAYQHVMPSPRSPGRAELPSSSVNRSSAVPRSPVSSYRPPTSHQGSTVRALPPPVPAHPVSPRQPPPPQSSLQSSSSPRLPPPQPPPPKPTSRRLSLSLAAITTPYTPDNMPRSQSKNQEAQTLPWLGQRLRPALTPSTGPAPSAPPSCHLPPILTDLPSAAAQ